MRPHFETLSDDLFSALTGDELLLLGFAGESTDFVRLNHARVRQAGHVDQGVLDLRLVVGRRHASSRFVLTGDADVDGARARAVLDELRERVPLLPEDPHLLVNREDASSEQISDADLPEAGDAIAAVTRAADGLDLVGIWASGDIQRGFANSLGQRNWFSTSTFHLDWSVYLRDDKATKHGYAGRTWDEDELRSRMDLARERLEVLARPARRLSPGEYRAYLAPAAVEEILSMLCWGGFSLKAQRSKRSSLQRLVDGSRSFSPAVSLYEETGMGHTPDFGSFGFRKPARVPLVREGRHAGALISPRSAQEFGVEGNGASGDESPHSLVMAPGDLPRAVAARALGTGLWINNLWYLNFSDRPACRITGMTRFATLWVEDGQVVAPVDVMRFDDSAYDLLGEGLEALTAERDLQLDAGTYGQRSTTSTLLPGALVKSLKLTL